MTAAGSVLLAWGAYSCPRLLNKPAPLELAVRENHGDLMISWRRDPASYGARLQIVDGGERTEIFAPPELASVTYTPRTADIEIRLQRIGDDGARAITRCVRPDPILYPALDAKFADTMADAQSLQDDIDRNIRRVSILQKNSQELLSKLR